MALTYKGPTSLGVQDDYTKSLRDLGAQAPWDKPASQIVGQLGTKTGPLDVSTTMKLIGVGGDILKTIFGFGMADKPKKVEEKKLATEFVGPGVVQFQSNLQDPGAGPGISMAGAGGGFGSPRATAADRLAQRYSKPLVS